MKLEWNVFYDDCNKNEIISFNVFKHSSFSEEIKELLLKEKDKKVFSSELRRIAKYYYWSKSEYEIVVTSWPPYIDKEGYLALKERVEQKEGRSSYYLVDLDYGKKVDIYRQLELNWERFVDYVWDNKKEINNDSF